MSLYRCPRCQNQDPNKIGFRKGMVYCRACISFSSMDLIPKPRSPLAVRIQLGYALTPEQQTISNQLIECYRRQQSAMVDAVTGSGKTEIVFGLIQVALAEGKRIGFVIPRKDVVIELIPRFQSVFPTIKIVGVYGSHSNEVEGDLVVLTTHQMYRYVDYFDVIIFDEVDAFPYAGDEVLKSFVHRASRGIIVYLSATFSKEDLKNFSLEGGQVFQLLKRFHGFPIPQLQFKLHPFLFKWFTVIIQIKNMVKINKPIFIFVPTITIGKKLYRWLSLFFKDISLAYAAIEEKDMIVENFKRKGTGILITTSILERGITMVGLQVIIFMADHPLFNTATLIQMAGRSGRKKIEPYGEVILYGDKLTPMIVLAQEKIAFANAHL